MPVRAYIVPHVLRFTLEPGSETLGCWERVSSHFIDLAGITYSRRNYGYEGVDLVVANLSTLDHNLITANADVLAFPENLDTNLNTSARNQTIAALQSRMIPAQWITAPISWRQVLRTVFKIIALMRMMQGRGIKLGRLIQNGVTLDTQFQNLPLLARQKLLAKAQAENWDTSSLSGTSTVRQILKALADQVTVPPRMYGVDF